MIVAKYIGYTKLIDAMPFLIAFLIQIVELMPQKNGRKSYEKKLTAMVDDAGINTLTVMIMEVPCCRGLLALAQRALEKAQRKIPLKLVTVGINGEIKNEDWV